MEACGINDLGQIVGWGTVNGQNHAFLLTPQNTPAGGASHSSPGALGKVPQNSNVSSVPTPNLVSYLANTNTWFVNQQGNNSHSGQVAVWSNGTNGPFKTINRALIQSLVGQINVAAGTYSESVDLRGKNVQIQLQGNVILH